MIDLRQYIGGLLSGLQARRKRAGCQQQMLALLSGCPTRTWGYQVLGYSKLPTSSSQRRARLYHGSSNHQAEAVGSACSIDLAQLPVGRSYFVLKNRYALLTNRFVTFDLKIKYERLIYR